MLYQLSYRGVAAGILLSGVASFKRPGCSQNLISQMSGNCRQVSFHEFRAVRVLQFETRQDLDTDCSECPECPEKTIGEILESTWGFMPREFNSRQ